LLTAGLSLNLRSDRRFDGVQGGAAPGLAPRTGPTAQVDSRLINKVIRRITLIEDSQQVDSLITRLLTSESPQIISFLNAHGLNVCYRNHECTEALLQSDVILRDGIGMQLLFKALKRDAGLNMNGTDLIPEFISRARGHTLGILGTREPYLSQAAEVLERAGHNVVVCADGFQDKTSYLTVVEQYKPRVIVLAMGMPKQELVASYLKANVSYDPIVINGGAIADFIAGKVKRAPRWMREVHLEWAFRLMKEPKRLFARYAVGNLLFLMRIRDVRKTYIAPLDPKRLKV